MECPICNSKLKLLTGIPRQIEFKKEIYKVYESYYKCEGCGEEFNDVETGDKNLIQVYNQYRENHNILYPDEIINLRKKYGLTKVDMSLALGWGENTYSNYERGAIPNESHNSLLRLIDEPKQFLKLVESRNDLFDKNEIIKIQEKH